GARNRCITAWTPLAHERHTPQHALRRGEVAGDYTAIWSWFRMPTIYSEPHEPHRNNVSSIGPLSRTAPGASPAVGDHRPAGQDMQVYDNAMSKASCYLPPGFHSLTVHLTVKGAAEYIEFLKRGFDAIELTRSPSADGRLLNASVRIGDSVVMLNDVFPEFGGEAYRSGRAVRLTLYLPDADAAWAKALAAGCKVASQLRDQFWGDRYGELQDPFGFVWAIATHLEDLTGAEIDERRKKMFGGGQPHQT